MTVRMIDLEALRAAPVTSDPFPYLVVPGFIRKEVIDAVNADYPKLDLPGSFPLPTLKYGENFNRVIEEIRGVEMTKIIADKFETDLSRHPTMVTVRGKCRAKDGQIHLDSKTKVITVLIYMNGQWEAPGGRLRILRSPDSLENPVAEVPPNEGTLLAFRNQHNAWHGHESFEGQRRAIQLNWVRDQGVVWREQIRHKVSAFFKRASY